MPVHLPKSNYCKIAKLEVGVYSEEQGYHEANPYSVYCRPKVELVLDEEGYQMISGDISKELENLKVRLSRRKNLLNQGFRLSVNKT